MVLGVETIFSRDQHILDEWWRREIDETELRQRIRFDLDWGYDWTPFYELLVTAREHAEALYGLDCMPRDDLRKIAARDRHAMHKIAEIRQRHPNAVILVLFGESHLAPNHLPGLIREQLPQQKTLTVLQNVDPLYWQAAGEPEHVEAVEVTEDIVCVFNSTPLEKYENYRLHLSRWGRSEEEGPDPAPTIYNLIDSLIGFLGINRYSSHNTTQPKFLIDLLPEVFSNLSETRLRRLLEHESAAADEQALLLEKIGEQGSIYLPRINVFYLREFRLAYAVEEAARFLHSACRGLPQRAGKAAELQPCAYTDVLEHALAYFGSRVLCPSRQAGEPCQMSRMDFEDLISACDSGSSKNAAQEIGYTLGAKLYAEYLAGVVSRSHLRRLFLTHLHEPGTAQKLCAELAAGTRLGRKGPYPDHSARARRLPARQA